MKKNNQFVNGNMTIIGVGTVIEGVLKASTSTRIEGTVNGDITSDGIVVIANEGVVNGNILAADVKISGMVKGNLTISGKTELVSNGKLVGDIKTGSLSIDETAIFQGSCKMSSGFEEETDKKEEEIPVMSASGSEEAEQTAETE